MSERFLAPLGFTIVSGGQTGADRAGLDWAIAHGIAHGGWCPLGRASESGSIPERYQLVETKAKGYLTRTRWNVRDSDATVIFTMTETMDGGSLRTLDFAQRLSKPCIHLWPGVPPYDLVQFLNHFEVQILNVAGKRASSAPGVYEFVLRTLSLSIAPRTN